MNDQAFTFQTLHPDTIMDALFEQGIRVDSGLTPLNSYENRVYQFQDEDRQRYVVKFYRPERWSAEQIQEEHQFAHDLLDATNILLVPGSGFDWKDPDHFRIVMLPQADILSDAIRRMGTFLDGYKQK